MAKKKQKYKAKKVTNLWQGLIVAVLIVGCGYLASHLNGKDAGGTEQSCHVSSYGNLLEVKTKPGTPSVLKSYRGMDLSFNPKCNTKAETFMLTNICPQAKSLNAGSWKGLEEKCRQWAEADSAIYIVCGPVIDGNPIEYIGDSRVYVPRKFFKAIISPYAVPARGIGFIMPNEKVKGGMQVCAVTIDSIEALTGHDFFSSLPDDIENEIESQCDFHYWSTHRKR